MPYLTCIKQCVQGVMDLILLVPLFVLAVLSRLFPRPIDVGLGPHPLINNVYHKRALRMQGYSAETFVYQVYFITDEFDYRTDHWPLLFRLMAPYVHAARCLFRYRCLYLYFVGGALGLCPLLRWFETHLYRWAGIKVVVMPFGGDVQDLLRCPNLPFRHAIVQDYRDYRFNRRRIVAQVDRWTAHANHVISGCDWVDYQNYWDTLMLAHFSIDTDKWCADPIVASGDADQPLRVLHAPNHRATKGTDHFVKAVAELKEEGVAVELVLMEKAPNDQVREMMRGVDVVADQLVIGWYAMFALEAMAMGKPVLCYLRQDLIELYAFAGLVEPDDIPIVNCNAFTVKEAIRRLAGDRQSHAALGERGRAYVLEHHSLESVGRTFARINQQIGLEPSMKPEDAGTGNEGAAT